MCPCPLPACLPACLPVLQIKDPLPADIDCVCAILHSVGPLLDASDLGGWAGGRGVLKEWTRRLERRGDPAG
jgi:hypothetical protein